MPAIQSGEIYVGDSYPGSNIYVGDYTQAGGGSGAYSFEANNAVGGAPPNAYITLDTPINTNVLSITWRHKDHLVKNRGTLLGSTAGGTTTDAIEVFNNTSGNWEFKIWTNGSASSIASAIPATAAWTDMAITIDQGSIKIYVEGQLVANPNLADHTFNFNLIGAPFLGASSTHLRANLDNFRVFSEALKQIQVNALLT